MRLFSGPPPSNSTKVFREWATRKHAVEKGKTGPRQGYSKKASTLLPLSVFVVTIPQVLAGQGIRKAKRVGWRHFGFGKTLKHTVSAEILATGSRHRVARTYGLKPNSIVSRALRSLTMKHSRTKKYVRISLVKIPPLVSLAIWVRSRNAKEDLILPLESVVPELQRRTARPYVDVLPLLQRSAMALVSQSQALDAKLREGRSE
jgi:hypothetical protein